MNSIALQDISLLGAGVGTQNTIDTSIIPVPGIIDPNNPAHLVIWNDSGCGCGLIFKTSANTDNIPAGGWREYELTPGESGVVLTVKYIIPGAPVSTVMSTYYPPGMTVPSPGILGNSPIGGSVATSSIQTLSNESQAAGILVIDMGDKNFAQLVSLFNDGHAIWAIDISGIKHQVLAFSLTGNPVQLGQLGDTVEILGSILVDQNYTGNPNFTGNVSIVGTTSFDGAKLVTDGSGGLHNLQANPWFLLDGNQPSVQYGIGNGLTIQEGGGANGFVIGRLAGNSTPCIASINNTGGIGFKRGGINGTKIAEFKNNGNMVIVGPQYQTTNASPVLSGSQAFDGFDISEAFPVAEQYDFGTVVCPETDGLLHKCTHYGCDRALIVSKNPAFYAGGGTFDDEEEEKGKFVSPIAISGRVGVITEESILFGQWVTSNGQGGVTAIADKRYEYPLGYALSPSKDGRVLIFIR